ncbi:hypothetical protein ECDEC2B_4714 [Escherichia coli DEC2B]|uniref:Uncharacterized protein n=1 Tax=Escherichia coli DEC2D TaxID=868141 RepID=A0A828TTB6_ECOLX|nr:hypothetical protein EC236275_5195 [Escherichia coli 2362-75]EHU03807.1 hypothetical protein ECDEC1C_4745 [Escherichia coli DEC1C]EHU06609.1 hypothetical protein ECDEC1B_4666 [Escherichia coli DEC1B]EHU17537.1 hypothetical protein ECDEC1D_5002 [Escherichia coli DEC1D]EHU20578.1 hypothetical protein ECDEC1E_4799 [Escherichia coli DEC1E]EHU22409.1 hypothetical protein ECDEC2A_4665 [Escherichia coli DEC2A]EHU34743.1 hypothetical protein ECDEC2B_4714 [Escherichia coli DEC2B]EHU36682.1 hypothe
MYSFFNTHNPSPTIENTLLFLQPVQGLLFAFTHQKHLFIDAMIKTKCLI